MGTGNIYNLIALREINMCEIAICILGLHYLKSCGDVQMPYLIVHIYIYIYTRQSLVENINILGFSPIHDLCPFPTEESEVNETIHERRSFLSQI
jgi:hypothetical protein